MVKQTTTCGICLEVLKEGKNHRITHVKTNIIFILNMKGLVLSWLKENNTCPMCRHEFPSVKKKVKKMNKSIRIYTKTRPAFKTY